MSRADNNRRWNQRQRERGFMRGPQISSEAHERLRELAYRHHLSMGEVVTRLLLDEPLGADLRFRAGNPHGLSPAELQHAREIGLA